MPILRERSVSRIPGIQFLHDRLAFAAKVKHPSTSSGGASGKPYNPRTGAIVDAKKGFLMLNPSGDLRRTEERLKEWSEGVKSAGWDGSWMKSLASRLRSRSLYLGHGRGEQHVRSHRIRSLPSCAATILWSCSSGALREMGEFDRAGIDKLELNAAKLTNSKTNSTGTTTKNKKDGGRRKPTSIVAAASQSLDSCKLKYVTGASPVVYGIPFYLRFPLR
ncbi:hypothetical protein D9613_009755 [Agrocybe pediades]|uniref:separase n=1 Tax=Agrocybe pediades TaxID=84607 RepID=A0A8H4QXU1_9AGAR|nr:hypothetical protein D9613_009755 [Agrocybe pediades]